MGIDPNPRESRAKVLDDHRSVAGKEKEEVKEKEEGNHFPCPPAPPPPAPPPRLPPVIRIGFEGVS